LNTPDILWVDEEADGAWGEVWHNATPHDMQKYGGYRKYIRANLVPQWQPIETAPKDGTEILVFHPERNEQFVCYLKEGYWMFAPDAALATDPTHWMPLPNPPPATPPKREP